MNKSRQNDDFGQEVLLRILTTNYINKLKLKNDFFDDLFY